MNIGLVLACIALLVSILCGGEQQDDDNDRRPPPGQNGVAWC